jgi:hypothetical protein
VAILYQQNVSIQSNDEKKTENSSDKIEKYPAVTSLSVHFKESTEW